MPVAYLYRGVGSAEAPSVLSTKIAGSVGATPTSVQRPGMIYAYVEFAAAITADQKTDLDAFFSARGGSFAATDNTPTAKIGLLTESPDASFWKGTVSNAGTLQTFVKVQ